MTDPVAHLGAVPGMAADEESAVAPLAPVQTYLRTSSEIVVALHAGEIEFFEKPLGWQEWMEWRAGPGRRDRATRRITRIESKMWQMLIA